MYALVLVLLSSVGVSTIAVVDNMQNFTQCENARVQWEKRMREVKVVGVGYCVKKW